MIIGAVRSCFDVSVSLECMARCRMLVIELICMS